MRRVTRADLEQNAEVIRRITGDDSYSISYAYGQPRLERARGSVAVSPRLSTGELQRWIWAFVKGLHAPTEHKE